MALTDQRHAVRFALPDLIVRGADHTIYAPIYLDAALVNPSGATPTVSVYNAAGTAVVAAQNATVSGDIAQYTISAATLASEALGERWRVQWTLTLAGGTVLTPRNDAALVRAGLWPVISDVDVQRRMPALNLSSTTAISAATNWQGELDEAWTMINLRLIRLGNRPNLIMEPSALRECHMNLTLALIFEGRLASRLDEAYREQAMYYMDQYHRAWSELNPRYDSDDDGNTDLRRRPGTPLIWLSGGRSRWTG